MGSGERRPTTSWWWLTIVAPHSTTPFDLLHTIGTSIMVLGLALMLGRLAPRVLGVVFAAGTMTLTLYTLHVLALWGGPDPSAGRGSTGCTSVFALVFAALWRTGVGQGPLEWMTGRWRRLARAMVLALPDGASRPEPDPRPRMMSRWLTSRRFATTRPSVVSRSGPAVSSPGSRPTSRSPARALSAHRGRRRFTGQGLAAILVRAALTAMLEAKIQVLPFCPFVRRFIQRHHEFLELVPADERERFSCPPSDGASRSA